MHLRRDLAVLLLAASLSGGVLAQGAVSLDDQTLSVAVEEALQSARSLANADITVHIRDGYVTLSGFVATMEDIAEAGRLASSVRGVTGVKNKIRIAVPPSRG